MEVRAELPVRGVDVLLGTDLVPDGRMWSDDVRPVLKPQDVVHQLELACPPCLVPFEGVEIPVSEHSDFKCGSPIKPAGDAVQAPAMAQGELTPQESEAGSSVVYAVTQAMAAALPDSEVVVDS